jgi:hypothetical protein
MTKPPSPSSAEADLAFMRALVDGGREPALMDGPSIYLLAGLLYGVQCFYHVVELVTPIRWPGPLSLAVTLAVNITFFAWMTVVAVRAKGRGKAGSATGRAINAMFNATGLANVGLIIVFALNSTWRDDFSFFLLYPATVFILQGAAWYVAFLMRRRTWMALTALGWFVSGTALGLLLTDITAYLIICGSALLLFMALPGWIMMRQQRLSAGVES